MLTKDEQKNQNADAQKTGVQNTNLDDVLLGRRVKIARREAANPGGTRGPL